MKTAPTVQTSRRSKLARRSFCGFRGRRKTGKECVERDERGKREAFSNHPVYISHRSVFKKRARLWICGAYFSLFVAVLAVIVGILIFVYADRIAINDPRLADLKRDRKSVREDLNKEKEALGTTGLVYFDARRVNKAWDELSELLYNLPSYEEKYHKDDTRDEARASIVTLLTNDGEYRDNLNTLGLLSEDVNPTIATDLTFRKLLDKHSVDPKIIKDAIETALICAKDLEANGTLRPDLFEELAKISNVLRKTEMKDSLNSIGTAIDNADKEAEKKKASAVGMQAAHARALEQRLYQLDDEIAQIYQKVNPNNIYSVVPLLVIRLGAVILLVFLTQIFLSAYRYNASLSTHFDAVADALYLAPSHLPENQLSSKELFAFVKNLHPHDATYLLPESPISQIRALASSGK